jgi:exopolyphosphatase/guanosine-5'-triphosphate,3'-diphosphate pyrophosphatase
MARPPVTRYEGDRTRTGELEPIGVIDIGSNSVRLVVYEGAVRSPTPIFNEKVLAGLGRGIATTGRLNDEAIDRSLEALTRFRAISRILGVKNVRAIATAAAREAENGADFIARGEKASGVKINILTGAEEAEHAAKGIIMGFRDADGFAGDLGGGSLEIIDIAGNALKQATTLPLGGLRLIDTSNDKIEKAVDIADEHIRKISWIGKGEGRAFYAVGGTWRSLAKLHMEQTKYPLRVMHGYSMPAKVALEFCEEVRRSKKLSALPGIEEVSKARREVLPYGALVLERVLKHMKPKEVVFSVFGIREGLVYKLLSAAEQRKDPLIAFARDYANMRSRSASHAQELCDWTDALFAEPGPGETEDERRLRHAACLLSDIGWRAHPDYRGEQSLNVIAHAALGGIDHPGRVFLASSVYFRHIGVGEDDEGNDALSERVKAIMPKRLMKRARIVGAAVRAAHMMSIGRPGIIDETPVRYERDKLVLNVPKVHATLVGERLERRFGALAQLLERTAEIRIGK